MIPTLCVGSLNPCFNGRYSQSKCSTSRALVSQAVLILVLMEDTLRVRRGSDAVAEYKS